MKAIFTAILACLCISVIFAQENDTLIWTPEYSMKFRNISQVDISPDGKHVAYVVRDVVLEEDKSEYRNQIWVASSDGKMNIQYTRNEKSSNSPKFSPDGQFIAFTSSRSEKNQIWLMRLMGGEPEQITYEKDGINSFEWSPDGSKIAFLKSDEETEEEAKRKKEKSDVIEVDKNFKYTHLYTIDVEKDLSGNRKVQRLTNGDFHVNDLDWSPDGKEIVFSHKADPRINANMIDADISTVSSDSSELKSIVTRPGPDTNPKYSPDGTKIAFQSTGGQPEPIGMNDIYIVSSKGGQSQLLAYTPDRMSNIIDWSADGSQIYVAESYQTSRGAYSIPASPGVKIQARLLTEQNGSSSSIQVNSKTGDLAFVYQNANTPQELYISKKNQTKVKISNINADIPLPKMGKTEVIKWTSKDGMEMEGLLTYPVDYKKGDKIPLALQIHGGPAGVFSQTFTGGPSIYMTQYFAQNGIAILKPNPRGSSGYGKEFRYANFKDWGYGDYEDVMSGVDKVIEMGVADENRMTVMGWSYGGYLTSFLVTKTNRFKAASMGAGLPNLISMTMTTDIPDYLVGHMGGEFWDDYDTYEKHSAMYHIKNVETPTQVIHGANDLRVPFTQGQEFYTALSRRGIETEMLVLPRTPHGPQEPRLLMEVSPRIMNWFNHYIAIKP
jgi:dipeptidyl aminopeptidase/acylaminoacyl peptidase